MFKSQRPDGRSYRDVVIAALKEQPTETIVTYEELSSILELDPEREHTKIIAAVNAAVKPLLKLHQRGIQSVRNVGYRILPAREHVLVANKHQGKAERAMTRALSFYEGTNLSELSETERRLHHGQYILAQAIVASHRHLDKRITQIEKLLGGSVTLNQS